MIPQHWNGYLLIIGSFFVALLLAVYPLPMAWRWWRPELVLMVAIYWISVFPLTISLLFLCLLGLYQDLLEGVPFGQHGLSLVIVSYICILSYQRVRNFAVWKEAGWIFVLVGLAQLPGNWVQSMAGRPLTGLYFLAPALTSALIWPFLRMIMDSLSRHYRVT
ncbi:MAG: rod shape-determining protein MreD [Gammaproteobacteria bacterium]|nr:MAG: rod shape-determining protein MreD [Gammaproteobacteria bacterium]